MNLRFHKNAIIFLGLLVASGGAYIGSRGFVHPLQRQPVEITAPYSKSSTNPADTDIVDFTGLFQKRLQGPPPLPVQTEVKNDTPEEEQTRIHNTPPPPVTVLNIVRSPRQNAIVVLRNSEGIKKSGFEGDSVFEWKINRIDFEGSRVFLEFRGTEYSYSLQKE